MWQDSCCYLYLPRLVNDLVLRKTIEMGVESIDFFGYALGKEDDRYLGFVFGWKSSAASDANSLIAGGGFRISLDEHSLIIDRDSAATYKANLEPPPPPPPGPVGPNGDPPDPPPPHPPGGNPPPQGSILKKRFYGTVPLDAVTAKVGFSKIADEVMQQFTIKPEVELKISIEIEANSPSGFDENTQRAVKENCNVLNFQNYEFEEE